MTVENHRVQSKKCVRQAPVQEDDDDVIPRALKFNLRPILVLMAVGGCYSLQSNKRKVLSTLLWIYKGFLTITIILYTLRNISMLGDPTMAQLIGTVVLLSFLSIGNLFVSWKTFSTKYGHFSKTMKRFEKTVSTMVTHRMSVNITYFTRRHMTCCLIAVLTFLSGIVLPTSISCLFFSSTDDMNVLMGGNHSVSITQPLEDNYFSRILFVIAMNINVLPNCFPGYFVMTVSFMILTAFNAFNKTLDYTLEMNQQGLFERFEKLRKIHVDLCSVVSHFDKDLGLMYGNIFLWTICEGLVVLYVLVKYPLPWLIQITMVYYLGLGGATLISMSICAALVRDAAHAPLDVIYNTDVHKMNLDKATQLNLFLSKLTGTQVGFTVFGLLTITKEFILTIAGVFLTYFAVLYTL